MLLSMAIFSSRVYAVIVYDYDITEFEQEVIDINDNTFNYKDTFSDDVEPPSGDISNSDYSVYTQSGVFPDGRESDGLMRLISLDGVIDDEKEVRFRLDNSTYYFTEDKGGHVIGKFEANDGFWSNSVFGIVVLNELSGGGEPATPVEAGMAIFVNSSGDIFAEWGNEDDLDGQDITNDLIGITDITMKLVISTTNMVSAMFDYGSDAILDEDFELKIPNFTTLDFTPEDTTDILTGGVAALEFIKPIPEPTTMALLGIGLAGLGGRYLRRFKQKAVGSRV